MFKIPRQFWAPAILTVCLYIFSIFFRWESFSMTPFRESHTANAAYQMAIGESPFFAYEVPVLGLPWSAPMEFPLFQGLVALFARPNLQSVIWTGKMFSLMFWLGGLYLTYLLGKTVLAEREDRMWLILLVAVSPIYASHSTSFLVESFALTSGIAYLYFYVQWRKGNSCRMFLGLILSGICSVLVKSTTWAPFAGLIVLAEVLRFFSSIYKKSLSWTAFYKHVLVAMAVVTPLVAGLVWVHFGDQLKMLNPLAEDLVSANLSKWNYGSLSQKLSPTVWTLILGRGLLMSFGFVGFLIPLFFLFGLRKAIKNCRSNSFLIFILLLVGFIVAPAVFTNLYFRHDYYLVANVWFLVFAFVVFISMLRGVLSNKQLHVIYCSVFLSSLAVSLLYIGVKKGYEEPEQVVLVQTLRSLPEKGSVILVGYGWSSHIPLEAERRAIMLDEVDPSSTRLERVLEANHILDIAAIVYSNDRFAPVANRFVQELKLDFSHRTEFWPGATILTPDPVVQNIHSDRVDLLQKTRDKANIQNRSNSSIVFLHSFLFPGDGGDGLFELMVRRGNEVFYVNLNKMRLFRFKNFFSEQDDI